MSLSVIMEEPSGFEEGDLEFVGRISNSPSRGQTQTHSGASREPRHGRYGSPKGRYIKAPAGRSLGGLRLGGGQSYAPNSRAKGIGRDFYPDVMPIRFARNPRHPKSLYDTELSMRYFMQRRMPKMTPGMSFPDPKKLGAVRNPMAPRFHHEYDLTEEDYNIRHNPLAGVDLDALTGGGPSYNRGYDDTGDNDNTTSEDSSGDSDNRGQAMYSEAGSEAEHEITADDSVSRRGRMRSHEPKEASTVVYSSVKKYQTPPGRQPQTDPPPFEPQPPPPTDGHVHLPRAYTHQVGSSRQSTREDDAPPLLPKSLHTLTEEDEVEETEDIEEAPETYEERELESNKVVDMSTQTNVTVQDIGETVAAEANEEEDRFVQIPEGRGDSEILTHDNWEVVAPWSRRSSEAQVTRNDSLAVNYRRVVAELSGNERSATSAEPQPEDRGHSLQHRDPTPPEDPPPWSPPVEPSRVALDLAYPGSSHEWDQYSRRYRGSMSGFWNLCCFVILMVLALLVVAGAIVVTALYVTYLSNCTESDNCGLLQKQGYLAGFVTSGAAAILIVFALFTWCCYNLTRRERGIYKYRPRESARMHQS